MADDDVLDQLAAAAARFVHDQPGDADLWRGIAEQGWLLTAVDEAHGGVGLGIGGLTVLARALGRKALRQPFTAIAAGTATCLAAGADRAPWGDRLAQVIEGSLVVTLAWQDVRGGLDPAGVTATGTAASATLSGTARFVAAPAADAFLIAAGDALHWVPRDAPGLTVRSENCPDGSMLAWLSLDGVAVAAGERLDAGQLRGALDATLIACAAELLGVMDGALDLTLDYLRTRTQFGVAIGSFQALQHRAVDLWIQRELTEAAVREAAMLFDDPAVDADRRSAAASGAKARASEAAVALCNQALQLHGAIGFAEEYGLGKFLNRALTLAAWGGNAAQHRARFVQFTPFEAIAAA